ncbi:MAG: alpha/beta fold hydrolase [Pseudomonadota bacterium]
MRLHHDSFGDGPARPVLIAHGLYGSGRNWGVIAKRLSDRGRVVTVDMRNHGASGQTDTHSYEDLAKDLADTIEALGAPFDVVGHSMGGKAAMALAVTRPALVSRLVVGDIAPVAYGHSQIQFIEAMRKVDLAAVARRSDAAAALGAAGVEPALQAFLTQSLDIAGRRWRLNLDTLAAEMPKILSFPALPGTYPGPALILSGADSAYVTPEHRPAIKALLPAARFAKIKGAGHWLHADQPRAFEAAVRAFLDAP